MQHPSAKASLIVCSQPGSSSVKSEGSVSVCIHLSQRARQNGEKCTFPECVCFTAGPMLRSASFVNTELCAAGLYS